MVEIDPTQKKYAVRFRPKDQRANKTDYKLAIFRAILGIADTNNILEDTKESEKVKDSVIKNSVFVKDLQMISDINRHMNTMHHSCNRCAHLVSHHIAIDRLNERGVKNQKK